MTAREATLRDLAALALGHATALYTRRPAALRWLAYPTALTTALTLAGAIGRREVFTTGRASSVRMSPQHPRPTPVSAVVLTAGLFVVFVLAVPLTVATAAITAGGGSAVAGMVAVTGYLVAILAGPLLIASTRTSTPPDVMQTDGVAVVVRLHDLVRAPSDPPGTGVGLLAEVIRMARYERMTVVATAAKDGLADAYAAAGMLRTPGTRQLTRPPVAITVTGARA